MEKLMTFKEMTEKTLNLYPDYVEESLKSTIYNWFQFRYVVDNDKFPVFFQRVLDDDYDRYHQLLRIEPGVAQYDWLVNQYQEMKAENIGTVSNNTDITNNNTATIETLQNRTGNASVNSTTTEENRGYNAETFNETDTKNLTFGKTGTETSLKTGTEDTTKTGTEKDKSITTLNTTSATTKTGTETLSNTGTVTDVKSGTDTDTRTPNLTTNVDKTETTTRGQSIRTETNIDDGGTSTTTNDSAVDNVAVLKNLPQESSGIGGHITKNGVSVLPGVDFTYATSYNENSTVQGGTQTTTNNNTGSTVQTINPLTGSDKVETNSNTTESGTDEKKTLYNSTLKRTNDTDETTTYALDLSTKDTGTIDEDNTKTYNTNDNKTYNLTDKTTYDINETQGGTDNKEGTNKIDFNSDVTKTTNGTRDITDNAKGTRTQTQQGDQSQISNVDSSKTITSISTGRDKEIAEMLRKASAFIKNSCAWDWLRGRLEVCFMSVYDI